MNRREALSAVTVLFGGTVIGANAFLTGCSRPDTGQGLLFDDDAIALLNEIGETILPATASSPGAKGANVGAFMKTIVTDCYNEQDQAIFFEGLNQLKGKGFHKKGEEDRYAFVMDLEREASESQMTRNEETPSTHYYTMIKQLAVWGFLSSEAGATKALRHVAVPGRYEGCIPLNKGDKAWA